MMKKISLKRATKAVVYYVLGLLGYLGFFNYLLFMAFPNLLTWTSTTTETAGPASAGYNQFLGITQSATATVTGPSTAYSFGVVPTFNRFIGDLTKFHIVFLAVYSAVFVAVYWVHIHRSKVTGVR